MTNLLYSIAASFSPSVTADMLAGPAGWNHEPGLMVTTVIKYAGSDFILLYNKAAFRRDQNQQVSPTAFERHTGSLELFVNGLHCLPGSNGVLFSADSTCNSVNGKDLLQREVLITGLSGTFNLGLWYYLI